MKTKYKSGAHTTHRLLYHFTFIPKYRKQLIRGKLKRRLVELFLECCEVNHWHMHKLEVLPDHIHMLLQLNPKDSPSKAIQFLKGGSSFVIRKEFASDLKAFLWGDSFWADGFFVESIGSKHESTIRTYLDNQQTKHS